MSFNVLITSLSKKVPLVRAIMQALDATKISGEIIGGDSHSECIGRYFVDDFWLMPKQEELSIKKIIETCQKRNIRAIIPTRDGELPFFALHKDTLLKKGIFCLISPIKPVEICRDKLQFADTLAKSNFPSIPTSTQIREISAPTYVVKERFGAGSRAIGINLTSSEAKKFALTLQDPIYQPFINGTEFSIDLYVDLSKQVRGVIARRRELIVNGESQITSTVKNTRLEEQCTSVAKRLGLYGHAVFQVLCSENQELHIIECNPRFGGASTLSLAAGLDTFKWFFQECLQVPLSPFVRCAEEKRQVRYAADLILDLKSGLL